MRRLGQSSFLLLFGLFIPAARAESAPVLYSDFASWSAAVANITTVNVPAPVDPLVDDFGINGSVTYSGVAFATANGSVLFNIGTDFSGASPVVASQFGSANILAALPSAFQAIGLNFGQTFGGTVDFTLSNGDTFSVAVPQSNGYEATNFTGVISTVPLTSILLVGLNNVYIRDISYADVAAVPEPATLSLVVLGIAAAAARRLRPRA